MSELRLLDDDGTLTVAEVGRRVERAIRRELPPIIWVRGEIQNLKRPPTGHVHLSLVGEDCSLPVVLFQSDRDRVNRSLKAAGNAVRMADGTEVRIRCEVRWFAPKGQVSLRMLAIDPAFTLGQLAERRELLLQALAGEGLLRAQARLPMPALPLRIGVVTSLGSAAHGDLLRVLEGAGIGWRVVECHASVQGPDSVPSLVAGLGAMVDAGVDVVCLVRGGGARTDLAGYDAEPLARAIAALPVPVLTGIGHEVDTSIADEVAWQRHPTPTACAAWLVDRAQRWCRRRDDVLAGCLSAAASASDRAARRLDRRAARASAAAHRQLRTATDRLDARAARVAAADPARLLARGWSITRRDDGGLVRSGDDAGPGAGLVTTVSDGEVRSRVEP
jgi:exodeoxyribonuclease VII large subunit